MHLDTEFMMSLFAAFMTTSLVNVTGSLLSSERCFLNSSSSASSGRSPNSRRYAHSSKPKRLLRNPRVRSWMS